MPAGIVRSITKASGQQLGTTRSLFGILRLETLDAIHKLLPSWDVARATIGASKQNTDDSRTRGASRGLKTRASEQLRALSFTFVICFSFLGHQAPGLLIIKESGRKSRAGATPALGSHNLASTSRSIGRGHALLCACVCVYVYVADRARAAHSSVHTANREQCSLCKDTLWFSHNRESCCRCRYLLSSIGGVFRQTTCPNQ